MAGANGYIMDRPLPFIETRAGGQMVVNPDVINILGKISTPVSVISIVGKYRTGKSYLMNRFFDSNAGFSLGPTIQATTKGIWIWIRKHPADPNRTLVLLDTEGLHDVEKGDETHDMKLFSLALLLSSCLVYNATGTLDDIIIQQLHLVSELTEHIRTKDNSEEDGNHFNKYFPSFFLVLRDFFLRLEIDGKPCSPDQYLENALKPRKGQGKKTNEYNMPRECIQAFFPRRKCFVLCKPVDDDDKLACLDKVHDSEIKPKFLEDAKVAIHQVLTEAKPFQLDGNIITGSRYCQLAQTYVEALNNGAVPCISNAVQLLKENECQRAVEESVVVFNNVMIKYLQGHLPVTQEQMTQFQKNAHNEALEHYRKQALFDKDGTYVQKLTDSLEEAFDMHINNNNQASGQKCQRIIQELFDGIDNAIQAGAYTGKGGFGRYKKDRDAAIQKYESTPQKGPMSEEVLNEFIQARKSQEYAIINADKALTEKEKELARENEERKRQEEKAKAASAEQQRLMQQMIAQQESHQETLCRVQTDFAEQQKRLMQEHKQDMEEKEMTYRQMMDEGLTKQAGQYAEIIGEMKDDKVKLQEKYEQQVHELQDFQQKHKDLLKEMKENREVSEKRLEQMRQDMEKIRNEQKESSGGPNLILGFVGKVMDAIANIKKADAISKLASATLFNKKQPTEKNANKPPSASASAKTAAPSQSKPKPDIKDNMDLD